MTQYTVMRKDDVCYAVSDEGDVLPVVHILNEDGEECELEEATRLVAGPTKNGKWVRITVTPGPLELFH